MEGIGMIRLDREDLPIDLLGGLQPTALMVSDRDGQCFGSCLDQHRFQPGEERTQGLFVVLPSSHRCPDRPAGAPGRRWPF